MDTILDFMEHQRFFTLYGRDHLGQLLEFGVNQVLKDGGYFVQFRGKEMNRFDSMAESATRKLHEERRGIPPERMIVCPPIGYQSSPLAQT
jgi:hypothetical protein